MKVLIIHQYIDRRRVDELDTLVQVQEICYHLKSLGHETSVLEIKKLSLLEDQLKNNRPDAIFNLVESFNSSDRYAYLAPAILEAHNISFTGNTAYAHLLACEKNKLKRVLNASEISTPGGIAKNENVRFIVKSVSEHASFGLDETSIVYGSLKAQELISKRTNEYGGEWLAEEYIEGREFNLSLIEIKNEVILLPPAEIVFLNYDENTPKFLDYKSKWDEESHSYNNTPRKFCEDVVGFKEIATKAWHALELKGYARIDLRMDSNNKLWVIDVNPNPCLSADAGFMAAAKKRGITSKEVIEIILRNRINA